MSRHLWNVNPDSSVDVDTEFPVPRLAPAVSAEETTVELPRYQEPAEPALSMLSRGRHGMR
ncbi:MAG TPA: hypothetical protein VFQ77_08745 [Pseudonocardiaceae bacterium]|jgi:hypothetical protein|nr:hypothetical protein [Pseudonocardiaceae bacterium]